MIEEGVLPLVRAGLPESRVQITVLPWASGEQGQDGKWRSTASSGDAYDILCAMEVCALREALVADGVPRARKQGVEFMACQMREVQSQDGADVHSLAPVFEQCADQAGLRWAGADGVSVCAQSEGFRILSGEDVGSRIRWAYDQPHWTNPPYIFLNGRPLNCPSPTYCDSIWTPEGDVPLDRHGGLLDIACSLLEPPLPQACSSLAKPSSETSTVTKFCETCFEVGSFRWTPRSSGGRLPLVLGLGTAASGALLATAALMAWFKLGARAGDSEGPLLPAE